MFNDLINSLLEDFNIYTKYQGVNQSGPDAGSTSVQPQDTFPSKVKTISGKILPSKKDIQRLKRSHRHIPKGKQARYRDDIRVDRNQG